MTRLGRRFGLALALASLAIVPASGASAQETKPGQGQPQKRQAPAQPQARPQAARPPVVVQQSRPQPQYQRPAPRKDERRRGPDGRAVAGGVAAGVVGAIILNEAVRGSRRREVEIIEDDEPPRMSCRRLADLCDDGERWACRRFSRDCED